MRGPQCGVPRVRYGRDLREMRRLRAFFTKGLESLYVGSDLGLSDIEADAGPFIEMFGDVKQGEHVVNGISNYCTVVRIPFAS